MSLKLSLMYIKIYFDNKPLFLCDDVDANLQPYVHHDDAVFIDEYSDAGSLVRSIALPTVSR